MRNKVLLLAILLATTLSSCASPSRPPSSPYSLGGGTPVNIPYYTPFTHQQTIEHIVGPSETLWRISKTYDVPIETLMQVNGIRNANELDKGQRLVIPNTLGPRPVIPLYPSQRWSHIVIHHTATHQGNAFSIDQIHQKRGFWNGLGYHFIIGNGTGGKIDGQIEIGPRWIKQQHGAHANANNMNKVGIGISLIGNFSQSYVSRAQLDSLVYLVQVLQDYYGIPKSRVIGHRDVPGKNTECPGTNFPWREFKNRL